MKYLWILLVLLAFLTLNPVKQSYAATVPTGFAETKITGGLQSPTAMEFAPDGRLFILEKSGRVRIVKNNTLLPTPFLTLSVNTGHHERGLLGITFDPDFATNRYVYLYYTASTPTVHNRLSRFIADPANPDVATPGSETEILNLPTLNAGNHNGGAIHFGPDGKLYVAVGENAVRENAQSKSSLLGKILRLNKDGTFPSDNPFVGQTGAKGEIWAMGLRNPYTFAFQPGTGLLYANDVGETSFEEVNDIVKGGNYGWPACEGSCTTTGMTNPIYQYGRSVGRAITGGDFYRGTQFPQEYRSDYFFADYLSTWIKRLDPVTKTVSDFATNVPGAVDIKIGPDGALYYLSYAQGEVWRISYGNTTPTPGAGLSISLFLHGIGKGGDNVNPTSTGTMNPLHQQRTATVEIYNGNNQLIFTKQAVVNYQQTTGNFTGIVDVSNIPSGVYTARVKVTQYLKKSVPGIISLPQAASFPDLRLITGDTNNDNLLSILDYNLILDCFSDLTPAKNCASQDKKNMTDLTDDGNVNQFDYNLFLRELSVQSGE